MALLTTALISALAPAGIDAIKTLFGGIARKIGGLSVDDEIKLLNANVAKLEAIAKLDTPIGTPDQWVINLRASFRYIAAGVCIVSGVGLAMYGSTEMAAAGLEIAASAFSFIFGDRVYMNLKAAK